MQNTPLEAIFPASILSSSSNAIYVSFFTIFLQTLIWLLISSAILRGFDTIVAWIHRILTQTCAFLNQLYNPT